jgi:hypothetical protein
MGSMDIARVIRLKTAGEQKSVGAIPTLHPPARTHNGGRGHEEVTSRLAEAQGRPYCWVVVKMNEGQSRPNCRPGVAAAMAEKPVAVTPRTGTIGGQPDDAEACACSASTARTSSNPFPPAGP